jgi:hypothetical protein
MLARSGCSSCLLFSPHLPLPARFPRPLRICLKKSIKGRSMCAGEPFVALSFALVVFVLCLNLFLTRLCRAVVLI